MYPYFMNSVPISPYINPNLYYQNPYYVNSIFQTNSNLVQPYIPAPQAFVMWIPYQFLRKKSDDEIEKESPDEPLINTIIEINPKPTNHHMNGIIDYMQNHGMNIQVKSNSSNPNPVLNNILGSYLLTPDQPDSWIYYDFGDKRIKITDYLIHTDGYLPNLMHMKNWKIMTSNDLENWTTIDEQNDNSDLNGINLSRTFHLEEPSEYSRYVKIQETGPNWSGDYRLQFCFAEFYGSVGSIDKNGIH